MSNSTFTTESGQKVRYYGQFRYFVYGEVRGGDSKPWVEYRTDSIENARKGVNRARNKSAAIFAIIDTVTGEVVR